MPEYDLTISIIGKDSASGVFGEIERSLRNITETALGVALSRAIVRTGEALFQFASQAVNATAQIQLMQVSLQALAARELVKTSNGLYTLATAYDAAGEMSARTMDKLARISILSPYTVAAVQNTFRLNTAFGFTFKQAELLTGALLNMAAGVGADNEQLKRMSYNLSQIRLQNQVTKLDVRQLALAGLDLVDVLRYVSKQMGFNIKDHLDFNKLLKANKIDWDLFSKYFAEYADKYFGKASEKMARTLLGLKSTFSDVFVLTMPQIVGKSVEQITYVLNGLLNLFLKLRDIHVFDRLGRQLSTYVDRWLGPMTTFVDYLNEYLDLWDQFTNLRLNPNMTSDLQDLMTQLGGAPTILGAVRYALDKAFGPKMVERFDNLVTAAKLFAKGEWWAALRKIKVPENVVLFLQQLLIGFTNLQKFWSTYGPDIKRALADIGISLLAIIAPGVAEGLNATGTGFGDLTKSILDNGPGIVNTLRSINDWINNKLHPAIDKFVTRVMKAWTTFKNWVDTVVKPAFDDVKKWVDEKFLPAMDRIGDWITEHKTDLIIFGAVLTAFVVTFIVIGAIGGAVATVVLLVGDALLTVLAAALSASAAVAIFVALLAGLYLKVNENKDTVDKLTGAWDTLTLAVGGYWAFANQYLFPALYLLEMILYRVYIIVVLLVTLFFQGFIASMTAVWNFITTQLIPKVQELADKFGIDLGPAVSTVTNVIIPAFNRMWQGTMILMNDLIILLDKIIGKLKNLDFGSLEPGGSPSALELSLMGINKQLSVMDKLMPKGQIGGGMSTSTASRGGAGTVTPQSTTYYFAPVTVQSSGDEESYAWLSRWRA